MLQTILEQCCFIPNSCIKKVLFTHDTNFDTLRKKIILINQLKTEKYYKYLLSYKIKSKL